MRSFCKLQRSIQRGIKSNVFFFSFRAYYFRFIHRNLQIKRPRRSWGGQSLVSHSGGPGSSPDLVMWDSWWTKWRWGRFSRSTSVSTANLHSTNCSTVTTIYHLGLVVAAVPSELSHPTKNKKKLQIKVLQHQFQKHMKQTLIRSQGEKFNV
jgi:hypothetical protein